MSGSKELVKGEEKGTELQTHELNQGNAFEDYARSTARTQIVGQLLKFSKGDYLIGKDNEDFDFAGTPLVAVMDDLYVGWVKWVDGKPEEQRLGKVVERHIPERRKELGDEDEDQWEVDEQTGKPRDPWQASNLLILRTPGLSGEVDEAEDLYTFTGSSTGMKSFISELCKAYGAGMRTHPDEYPVIQLGVGSYMHSNKAYGRIKFPTMEVIGWEPRVIPEKAARAAKVVPLKAPAKAAAGKRK